VPVKHKSMFARILVPVANPATQEHLISLASILAQTNEGTLLPLNVAQDINGQMVGLEQQRELLEADVLQNTGTNMQPIRRIDTSIAQGILRAAIENDASLIVMGWRGRPTLRQSIFGTVLDEVVWNTELPVIVGRLTTPINAMRRIILVVPPRSLNVQLADRTLEVLSAIAQAVNVPVLALTARGYFDNLHEKLSGPKSGHPAKTVLLAGRVVQEVAEVATSHDLILVTTMGSRRRFRSSLGRIPEQIATTISCSIVVIHYQTGAV
jgi:nucleotide-binding universal stress UspA family protein